MNGQSRTINSIKNIMAGSVGQLIQTLLGVVNRTIFIKFLAALSI